jgi:penicillin-binding protein 1A
MSEQKDRSDNKPNKKKRDSHGFHGLKLSHIIILALLLLAVAGASTIGTVILAAMSGMPSLENNDITDYNVTSYIVDKDDEFVDKLANNTNYISVDHSEISQNMLNAVVSIEDKRFYTHHGVDPIRIGGAFLANMRAGHTVQGGSTITQQLAGLALLDRNEKTYKRKIQEAVLAVRIENAYSKEDILTAYLNRCYFGIGKSGMVCYGIEAAANDILGKHASDLTVADSALLAGLIQNPTYWSPIANADNAKTRRDQVLQAMLNNKAITQDEYNAALAEPIQTNSISQPDDEVKQSYNQSYIDYVIEEAMDLLKVDATTLYTSGYIIHTCLDQDLQSYMYDYFNSDYYFPGSQVQGAMVVIDSENSGIAGMIGGRHMDESQERGLNRATMSLRQPGSAFKPIFVYGPAFEEGKGTGSVYEDSVFTSTDGHVIKNADLKYRGDVTIRYALEQSLNTVAARVIEDIGPEKGFKFAQGLGITSLQEDEGDGVSDYTISAGLGGLTNGVSTLEMAGAYGAFANGGIYTKPHAITSITTEEGDVIWEKDPESHRAMSKETAYMMTSCLQSVVTDGIGSAAAIQDGRPTAGKTGTTDDTKDIYFCGYTPQYTAAVWIGYDTPTPMYTTSTTAAYAFGNIMSHLHAGLEVENFERPDGLTDVLIDTKTGDLASRSTPYAYRSTELFKSGTEPTTYSSGSYSYYQYNQSSQYTQSNSTTTQQQDQTQQGTGQGQMQNGQGGGTQNYYYYNGGGGAGTGTGGGGANTLPVQ